MRHWSLGVMVAALVGCGKTAETPPGAPGGGDAVASADAGPKETSAAPSTPDATSAAPAGDASAAPAGDASAAPAGDASAAPSAAARFFRGKVAMPGDIVLTMLVTIDGANSTLDIPMQHVDKAALTEVKASDDAVEFAFHPPRAPEGMLVRFSAKKVEGQTALVGELDQMGMKLPLQLEPLASAADFPPKRPQTPKPPFPYKTEAVKVEAEGASLGCTLVLPEGAGPHTAVVLLNGSGAQDRDETVFDHKPFLVLSDRLARSDIASLRCDDRSVGESTGDIKSADLSTFVADAKAMLAFLAGRAEIKKDKIGVIGHSEGGIVAAELAHAGAVAFVVTLAGPALSGREISARQNLDTVLSQGVDKAHAEGIEKAVDALFGGIAEDAPEAELEKRAKALADAVVAARAASGGPAQPAEALIPGFMQMTKNPWLKSWVKAKPAEALADSKPPVLALFGELDIQVHAPENAAALQQAFAKFPKANGYVEVIAGVNHLFQLAKTGKVSEYGDIEETIAPSVLDRVATWVTQQGNGQ